MEYTEVAGFLTRDGTTDANAVYALADDEYHLNGRTLSGWAIDIGAHIGSISVTMARQNPDLRVLAVEAVPDNADLLAKNVQRAGLADRITVIHAAAARPGQETALIRYGYTNREEGEGYVSAHRFVGNTWADLGEPEHSLAVPAVSLDSLMADYAIEDDLAFLKIDCEGCEWAFLDTDHLAFVQSVTGEYHGGYPDGDIYQVNPRERIVEIFAGTHDVEFWNADPTIGLFEAVRR